MEGDCGEKTSLLKDYKFTKTGWDLFAQKSNIMLVGRDFRVRRLFHPDLQFSPFIFSILIFFIRILNSFIF